jgi:glucose/arabinose dehydrogenase
VGRRLPPGRQRAGQRAPDGRDRAHPQGRRPRAGRHARAGRQRQRRGRPARPGGLAPLLVRSARLRLHDHGRRQPHRALQARRRGAPDLTGLQEASVHDGGRIAFGPDGKLYAGVGDAGNTANAQNRSSRNGKILRINPDGSIPKDNPFPGSPVWTLGHRNVQGLAWDRSGRLWATEFGQDTWDEINLIRKGRNYGWPIVEGKGSTHGGRFTNPLVTWPTDESSPSGAAILNGTLYAGALAGERLWKIPLHGSKTGKPVALLTGRYGRLRTIVAAPGGGLWVTTSNRDGRGSPHSGDDKILLVRP